MPSDQRAMAYYNSHKELLRGEATKLIKKSGGDAVGEVLGTFTASGLSAGTYTDDVSITFYGVPDADPIAKVINQALGSNSLLVVPTYTDQNDTTAAWLVPGDVASDAETNWDGSNWSSVGASGTAGVTNAVVGTNAVNFNLDANTVVTDNGFFATGTQDYSAKTFISLWLTTDVALTAGDIQIGTSTAANFATGRTLVDIPAQSANTTINHIIAITGTALTESVGIVIVSDPGDGDIYLDDVRMMTTSEKTEYAKSLIAAGTAQNAVQAISINSGDRMANITAMAIRGGKSGDDLEFRCM